MVDSPAATTTQGCFVASVLQSSKEELIATYHPHNSNVVGNIQDIQQSRRMKHCYGVDATDLNATVTCPLEGSSLFERVVFCYPFPTSNGHVDERKQLIQKFFRAVRDWRLFNCCNGQVILGLKSTAKEEDYQFDYWDVEEIARALEFHRVATSCPMVPFWRATHVNGRPLDSVKRIFDEKSVLVKFYAFEMATNEQEDSE